MAWGDTVYKSSTPKDYKNNPDLRESDLGDPVSPFDLIPMGLGAKAGVGGVKAGLEAVADAAKTAKSTPFPRGSLGALDPKWIPAFKEITRPGQGEVAMAGLAGGLSTGASVAAMLANTAADIHRQGNRWVEDQRRARKEFEENRAKRVYIANNPVESLDPKLTPDQLSDKLSERLGVPAQYLKDLTRKESGNNPNAKASTSSAEGLTQFIDSTWERTLKEAGERLGYKPHEGDPKPLKRDPRWSIASAAELAKKNAKILKEKTGRRPTQAEVYVAHFMGAQAAAKMIMAKDRGDGDKIAASLYPEEAKANRNVFYDKKSGKPRTVNQVVEFQSKDFSDNEF